MNMPTYEDICASLREEESLSRVAEDLIRLIRPAIRMVVEESPIEEDSIPIGASKLGGNPDLPEGWEWPEAVLDIPPPSPELLQAGPDSRYNIVLPPPDNRISLPFIAQIRMTDLAGLLTESPLPAEGILYFFYNAQHYNSDRDEQGTILSKVVGDETRRIYRGYGTWDLANCCVLYWPDETAPLNRLIPPDSVPPDHIYSVRSVSFEVMHLLPSVETTYIGDDNDHRGVVVLEYDVWCLYSEIRSDAISNADHVLGYSQDGQPYAMEASYQNYRSQLFPDLPEWETLSEEKQQQEYRSCSLLLQVEPHDNGMRFGRAGALFVFIRNEELERRDFSCTWAWIQ
jgi:uncharacterized protein YwqG